jgi:hypothetical protein
MAVAFFKIIIIFFCGPFGAPYPIIHPILLNFNDVLQIHVEMAVHKVIAELAQ